ncbi:MAG TPA: isopentenyl-diphosphate Delta-isomerase [Bacteroidia bacterium]|jgi:isopentenyl-diphosphate delta-isomerase|nr:isopentenyl-diphosphate Delta-isomerase [Bacteroidia bacterium]
MIEEVILVNEADEPIGTMNKMEAHEKGLLHRAISVFIFNSKNQMLLQQRALNKYHSGGLWTNSCCSHPRPGETTLNAAKRRLKEEMGIETDLTFKTAFTYKTKFDNGLTEHEVDHVFTGYFNEDPKLNPNEANNFKWKSTGEVKADLKIHPENYTSWFKIAVESLF